MFFLAALLSHSVICRLFGSAVHVDATCPWNSRKRVGPSGCSASATALHRSATVFLLLLSVFLVLNAGLEAGHAGPIFCPCYHSALKSLCPGELCPVTLPCAYNVSQAAGCCAASVVLLPSKVPHSTAQVFHHTSCVIPMELVGLPCTLRHWAVAVQSGPICLGLSQES